MSAQPQPRLTPEQYLEIERAAEIKSEYYNGRMYAMSGASYKHVVITGNLRPRAEETLYKKRQCTVLTNDLRLRVAPDGLYTYPDLIVVCGDPNFVDHHTDTLLNPVLIASRRCFRPVRKLNDRGFEVRPIPYAAIAPGNTRWSRKPNREWRSSAANPPAIGCYRNRSAWTRFAASTASTAPSRWPKSTTR